MSQLFFKIAITCLLQMPIVLKKLGLQIPMQSLQCRNPYNVTIIYHIRYNNFNHFNNYYYKGTRTNLGRSWNGAPENFTWEVNGITTNADAPVTIYSKNNVIFRVPPSILTLPLLCHPVLLFFPVAREY